MSRLLRDAMPCEFVRGEYNDTAAYALRDVPVVTEIHMDGDMSAWKPWPGRQKNVFFWVVLANGKAVGFNENPSKGWSFPVIRYKAAATRAAGVAPMKGPRRCCH